MEKIKLSPYQELRILILRLRFWIMEHLYPGPGKVIRVDVGLHRVTVAAGFTLTASIAYTTYSVVVYRNEHAIMAGVMTLGLSIIAFASWRATRKTAKYERGRRKKRELA